MSSSLTCTRLTLCTVSAVLVQIIGLSLFVLGFFPVKPALPGFSGPESFRPPGFDSVEDQNVSNLRPDQLKSLYQELYEIPPSFDRLILMQNSCLEGMVGPLPCLLRKICHIRSRC